MPTVHPLLASQEVLATAAGAIGGIVVAILVIGFVIAVVSNMRRGRAEVGSELELAANRKPYLSDEELEGQKLDRTLGSALRPARRHRHHAAALLAGRARPPGGRGRSTTTRCSSPAGSTCTSTRPSA